jgi:hypothetical protein
VVGAHSSQRSLHLAFSSCFGDEQQQLGLSCTNVTAAAAAAAALLLQDTSQNIVGASGATSSTQGLMLLQQSDGRSSNAVTRYHATSGHSKQFQGSDLVPAAMIQAQQQQRAVAYAS